MAWTTSITQPHVTGFALRAADWDGRVRTLIEDPQGWPGNDDPHFGNYDVAGSGTRLATHWFANESGAGRSRYSTASGFESFGGDCSHLSLDVSGDELAYACNGVVTVMDLNTGAMVDGAGRQVRDVHIAGKYLAWVEPMLRPYEPHVVVYDREAGREVYRVDIKALLPPSDFTYVYFDLRADGTVVAAYNNYGAPGKLAWFSPSQPYAHPIADKINRAPSVAGNLIAVIRQLGGRRFELAVIDFSGNTVQVFDRDDSGYVPIGVDFDGERLTWHRNDRGVRLSRFPVENDLELRPIRRLSIKPSRFQVVRDRSRAGSAARRRGTIIRFSVAWPATVRAIIERRTRGVQSRGKCRRASKPPRARRCVRYARVGALSLGRRKGAVRYRFRGRVAGRALRPGRYRAVIETVTGNRAIRERSVPFRILR